MHICSDEEIFSKHHKEGRAMLKVEGEKGPDIGRSGGRHL
jgi:hypothetical protein